MPKEELIPVKGGGWLSVLPHATKKPNGYCIHKYTFGSKKGLLTKLELFAYFEASLIGRIKSRARKLQPATGKRPPYFHQKGKYKVLLHVVVMWDKAPVEIKAYKQGGDILKLEVTRGVYKGRGRKFLSPISALNSLGLLLKNLTDNEDPIRNSYHDDYYFVDEFLESVCEKHFQKTKLQGQLRLLKKQKLRNNIKFGFKRKQSKHF